MNYTFRDDQFPLSMQYIPKDSLGQPAEVSGPVQWTATPEGVVSLTLQGDSNHKECLANFRAIGTVTIRATDGAQPTEFNITITAGLESSADVTVTPAKP